MTLAKHAAALAATVISVFFLGLGSAGAAPQVLTLLATEGPMPLVCAGGSCVAELPSLCLQPERRAPAEGRAYRAIGEDGPLLVGQDVDGELRALPLPPEARITALRTHVAVALVVPRAWIERHFSSLEGVAVSRLIALAPVPSPEDATPLTAAEIARAATDLQTLVGAVLAAEPENVAAARIAARMVNLLPTDVGADDEALAAAWRQAGGAETAIPARSRFDYAFCRAGAHGAFAVDARACFQAQHDGALEYLHARYVESLRAGS
jgi:hypothetical protein